MLCMQNKEHQKRKNSVISGLRVTKLQILAIRALTNLFLLQKENKDIFMDKKGLKLLLQKLSNKQEKVVEVILNMLVALIKDG